MLKNNAYYIVNSLRFYGLKNYRLARIVFVIILFVSLLSMLLPSGGTLDNVNDDAANNASVSDSASGSDKGSSTGISSIDSIVDIRDITIPDFDSVIDWVKKDLPVTLLSFLISLIISLASSVYLFAFTRDIRGEECGTREAFAKVITKLLPLAAGAGIFFIGTFIGFVLLIIPGIIFYLSYLLYSCYILDRDLSLFKAYKACAAATRGNRARILGILASFILTLFFPMFFLITLSAGLNSRIAFYFVFYFLSSIAALMQQRMLALIYFSLAPIRDGDKVIVDSINSSTGGPVQKA